MAQHDADFQLKCQIIEEVKERPLFVHKGHLKYQINLVRTEEFTYIRVAVSRTGEYHMDLVNQKSTQKVKLLFKKHPPIYAPIYLCIVFMCARRFRPYRKM